VLRIVQYSLKQLIVSVLQQLFEVWHVRWTEAASAECVYRHPLHAIICRIMQKQFPLIFWITKYEDNRLRQA